MALSQHSSPFYFLRAGYQPQLSMACYRSQRPPHVLSNSTAAIIEVIPRGKCFGSARIQTQNSCVTVNHSNHVAKELTKQLGCKE